MKRSRLYLIPVPIAEGALNSLSQEVFDVLPGVRHFIVENARSARRHIRAILPDYPLAEAEIEEIDKHGEPNWPLFESWVQQGWPIGIMSESGCPGIADPGSQFVAKALELGASVHPLVGPNSLILALMSSGLSGQQFAFHGYLPIKNPERLRQIQMLEQRSRQENQTQIFIETPYRNQSLFDELLKALKPSTKLCVALDIQGEDQWIQTHRIAAWRRLQPSLKRRPAVFLFLAP